MNTQKDPWASIFVLLMGVATLDVVLVIFALSLPEISIIFIALIIASVVISVFRCRRILVNAKIAERVRQRMMEEEALGKSSTSAFGKKSYNQAGTTGNSYNFPDLKSLAREYETKSKRYNAAQYTSVQDICKKLNEYAARRGFKLAENTAEDLLRAMMSSRCIFIKSTDENVEDVLSVIAEFFSGMEGKCVELPAVLLRPSGLLYGYQNGAMKETDFFKSIYGAPFFRDTVYTCNVKGWSDIDFGQIFSGLIPYFKNPALETVFTLPQTLNDIPYIQEKRFIMPTNTWFFFLKKGDEQPLPSDASLWSSTITLHATGVKVYNYMDNQTVSYTQFNELIESAFDDYFLPLDTWKKLDKVEDYLFVSVGFKIDNVLARQIEQLTTIYVACGGTQAQAMDIAIAKKILPAISRFKRAQIDQENTTFKELLDGLFGAENLPETHKGLSALGLD